MRNHQQSDKPARNRKSRQLSGGEFQDEDRDSGRSSNSRGTTDNRPHKNRSGDHSEAPSIRPRSNFGDDEIGGTSFDPGPVHSEEKERDEQAAKARRTPAETKHRK